MLIFYGYHRVSLRYVKYYLRYSLHQYFNNWTVLRYVKCYLRYSLHQYFINWTVIEVCQVLSEIQLAPILYQLNSHWGMSSVIWDTACTNTLTTEQSLRYVKCYLRYSLHQYFINWTVIEVCQVLSEIQLAPILYQLNSHWGMLSAIWDTACTNTLSTEQSLRYVKCYLRYSLHQYFINWTVIEVC